MRLRFHTAVCFLGVTMATSALADSYKFQLHNESKYTITGFQTYEGGKWTDWNGVDRSGVDVAPGETHAMDWKSDAGNCEVPFRITYKDAPTEQYTVDWCKISGIRVHNDSVTADYILKLIDPTSE